MCGTTLRRNWEISSPPTAGGGAGRIAKPIGIPMAAHRKKLPSIKAAEKLTSRTLDVGPPVSAEKAVQTDSRAEDGTDHENGEAGIN